jgi:glyoxylase-like metal-dependent hydrolase (beta-lactamase superfamily II)
MPQQRSGEYDVDEVVADVARLRIATVNVYFLGRPWKANRVGASNPVWVLVDAGLPHGAAEILRVAGERFGVESRPAAIVLTHGHFDHVGALPALLAVWDVPVYAHMAELPFLTGRADFPPPDPTVGSGPPRRLAPEIPEAGLNLGDRVQVLPANGRVPALRAWQWLHTPGHSPGHISLFRATDRFLIAGDAVATTDQASVYSGLAQRRELSGPPAYLTIDWDTAERSVSTLASMRPTVLAAGHGRPMSNVTLAADLSALARDFRQRVRPTHGRYVLQPAFAEGTHVSTLPVSARSSRVRWGAVSGVAAAALAGTWLYRRFAKR